MGPDDRYVVISSDCHGGAPMEMYREYLDPRYLDEFDAWREAFDNPFADLVDTTSRDYRRNFDTGVRQEDLEGDGIVGEVVFPNTIPPFFAGTPLFNPPDPTSAHELELRWAGVRAHNRWLADFCGELPGRRAGVAQILLDDIDRVLLEVRWAREQPGLFGGILLPNPSGDSKVAPLHAPVYEPLWSLCEELRVPVNTHDGGGGPNLGPHPATPMVMFVEFGWFAQRPLVRLLLGGVFERHPGLTFVLTETGNSWVPGVLRQLDWFYDRVMHAKPDSIEQHFGSYVREALPLRPSEYWARQCYLGASFLGRSDCELRHATGIDRMMWGADYPHTEGTHPHTAEALRYTFAGVDPEEVRLLLGLNAARAYHFDLDVLGKVAAEVGPRVADVDVPLARDDIPIDTRTMALAVEGPPAG